MPEQWIIEIGWFGRWVPVGTLRGTRQDAEWKISQWRQDHKCFVDPFRIVPDRREKEESTPLLSGG